VVCNELLLAFPKTVNQPTILKEDSHETNFQSADLRFIKVETIDLRDHLHDLMKYGTSFYFLSQPKINSNPRVRKERELTKVTFR
jgi:hypothetical protein